MNEKEGVCAMCNMIAFEDGINLTRDILEEKEWIKGGKQVKHLPDCPMVVKPVSGRSMLNILPKVNCGNSAQQTTDKSFNLFAWIGEILGIN